MMTLVEGWQPDEFVATATRAIAACEGRDLHEQARHLANDGLLGVMAPEDAGGLALPLAFAVPVVAAATAGLLGFPLLEAILLARHLHPMLPRSAEAVVAGASVVTIAWQGHVAAERKDNGYILNGCVARAPCANSVDSVLVKIDGGGAALVRAGDHGVRCEEASGLDVTVPEHVIVLKNVAVETILDQDVWDRLASDATVLRAAAILGSAETCLSMAQEHAVNRRQFGRALSSNQAIRHALARQKLGLESIRHALARGASDEADEQARDAAFLAAAVNGCAIGESAIQIHGGMGFTWDIPLHRHLRRMRAIQAQGNASTLLAALGRRYVDAIAPAGDAASSL